MSDSHINPQDYLDYYTSTKGITVEEIGVAPLVVISWSEKVITSLAEKADASFQENWMGGLTNCLYTNKSLDPGISFFNSMIGASATVMFMEELIACGARMFIGLGWAGSLQPSLPAGSLILPNDCISEEGTSAHYKSDKPALADSSLKAALLQSAEEVDVRVSSGTQWSTDAPYREPKDMIERFAGQGVLGVDMETSAMYALGAFRDVRVCSILVISDELFTDWNPRFSSDEVAAGLKGAEKIILKAIGNLDSL